MINPLPPEKMGICSFETDIEYLMAEVNRIRVRSERIEALRLLDAQDGIQPRPGSRRSRGVYLVTSTDRVARLQAEESALRREIDARLNLNRSTGPALGVDRLCQEYGLNDFERALLLLSFLPCLGSDISVDSISRSDSVMTSGSIYYEGASLFLELKPEDHLKSLLSLLPDRPLLRHGLIRFSYNPRSLSDVASVGIELTGKGMAAITGIPGYSEFDQANSKGDAD